MIVRMPPRLKRGANRMPIFIRFIRKSLQQKEDGILYEAIERTRYADGEGFQFLKISIGGSLGS